MFTLRPHVCLFYSHFLSSNRASASICNICNGKAHTPAFLFCILLCTVIGKWDQNKYLETFCNSVILSRQITNYYTIWVLVWLFNWYDLKRSVLFWYIVKHLEWLSQFTLQYSLQLDTYILAQGNNAWLFQRQYLNIDDLGHNEFELSTVIAHTKQCTCAQNFGHYFVKMLKMISY